jgi:hypothetical protein
MTIHSLFQTRRARPAATPAVGPARRLHDIEEIHRLPHSVTISDMGRSLAATIIAHKRWIEDPNNGTRGVYGMHYDTYNRGMIAFFSDANTAFWFRVRWGGAA